jgi:hypothetical protein
MRKLIATAALGLLLCVSGAASAEKPHSSRFRAKSGHSILLGLDSEFGVPLGNYADANSVGLGAVLTGEYTLVDTLSATLRIGFQGHMDRTVGTVNSHVHAIPILLGTKYYTGSERQGLFGAFELGMFDLMSSVTRPNGSVSSNDVKFGLGMGVGYQQDRWNVRLNVHSQDVGNFSSAFMISGGVGYQFAAL